MLAASLSAREPSMTSVTPAVHPGLDPSSRRARAAGRAAALADDGPADLVLTGGPVTTVDPARTTVEAIAIRAGRIVGLGNTASVAARVGASTRVIDLRGRTVVPGFGDAHIHALSAGMGMRQCDLREARGEAAYGGVIRRYAEAHQDLPWIVGDGWYMADFPGGNPTRGALDAVVPDRPVFLQSRDGHSAWVNSKALELAGVTSDTPDPIDGVIVREADRAPAGTLHEGAIGLVERLVPEETAEDLIDGLGAAQRYLHSLGLTQWQEAIVDEPGEHAYRTFAGRGVLTGRVTGAMWWKRDEDASQIDLLVERRAAGPVGRYRSSSVKIMQDGVLENFTGALIDPYLGPDGEPSANRGISMVDPAALKGYVTRLDALGFQVHFHCIGDRATREALDAFEAARAANGTSGGRHHISHIQLIHPADIPRFRALGVAANMQPLWACHEGQMDELTLPFLGPERATWQYPFQSLRRAGAVLVAGSDWSVSTPDPLLEMELAVNRVWYESRGEAPVFLPDERLPLIDALAAFTAGTAYVNHLEDETGSLELGKLADLVVLDRDLFDRGAGEIGDARVVATLVEGDLVYETPALGG
jgi:predicted amidohydrolase YtcJ